MSLQETWRRSVIPRNAADRTQKQATDNQVFEKQHRISTKIWAG
jgi:hypothetical protein